MGRIHRNQPMSHGRNCSVWNPPAIDNSEPLTLVSAVCQIIEVVSSSKHNLRIYDVAARPLSYIANLLELTEQQAMVYAIVMDIYYINHISTFDIARCLDISPIKAIIFSDDLAELCRRNYLISCNDEDSNDRNYSVTVEAIESLQQNRVINQKNLIMNDAEEWFGALDKIIFARSCGQIDYDTACKRVLDLLEVNKDLAFIKCFNSKGSRIQSDDKVLFMWMCGMVVNDSRDTIIPEDFKRLYDNPIFYRTQRRTLAMGTNDLMTCGLVRVATVSDQRSKDCYELTPWVVNEMLAEMDITTTPVKPKDVISCNTITPKQLYYNAKEQQAIDQLAALLQPARFEEVRNELVNQGFRKGFACLFHGAPGTGKTETVLQLARATGRDIMQVNISEIKSMWVGESEKNIKAIFTRYRQMVEKSPIAPILLFNEADAIIGKRLENVQRSVDKMENSMQNIILEEIEKLDGILIATTNLTCNMDSAFERRFLYKVEFEKPTIEVKSAIWQTMLAGLSDADAAVLASKYDFSGGQIENIARKSVVSKIITGEDFTLNSLIGHCDTEVMGKNADNRRRIGF